MNDFSRGRWRRGIVPATLLPGTLVLAMLALAPAARAWAQPQPPADGVADRVAEARTQLAAGRPADALAALEGLDADDPRVALLRGVAHYRLDEPVKAIARLTTLVPRLAGDSPERREAVQVLGLALYQAGRLPEALPLLEETRTWATDQMELSQVLGIAYIQTRQPDKARAALADAFGVPPASAAAHLLTAQMMVRVEFHEAANAELRKALALDPRLPHAHFLLAQNAVHRARLDEAIALFKKELEVNPADAMALYFLGEAYGRQQRWDLAIPALQKSLWINPFFSGPLIVLSRAYLAKEQPDTAEGLLRRAVSYDPNNKTAHYLLAQTLQKLGRDEEAAEEFDTAARLQDAAPR